MNGKEHPGKRRPWFRRACFKALFLLASLPVVLFFLGNLWFMLPPGRHWLAGRITSRIGFETELQRASWTPWDGVRVSGLVVSQPDALRNSVHEPLFSAASIQAWPVWRALFQKRIEFHSISIDAPRAVVPIELMAHFAGPPPAVTVTPAVASAEETPTIPTNEPPLPTVAAAAPTAVVIPPPTPTIESSPSVPAPPDLNPTGWIHIRHGSLSIVTASRPTPLMNASDFSAEVPAAGNVAASTATLEEVSVFGNRLSGRLEIPLQWQSPILQVGPVEGKLGSVPYRLFAKVARASGLPVGVEMTVPLSGIPPVGLPVGATANAEAFRTFGRFGGLLAAPRTWQGELVAEGKGLSVSLPGHPPLRFDQGIAVLMLRGGFLSCTDARLIGDDLSLLGNATVLSDSRTAAVLRVVTGLDSAQGLANGVGRATGKRMVFGALGTVDRFAADVYALGNLDGINIQLGQGGDVIDGASLLAALKAKSSPSP